MDRAFFRIVFEEAIDYLHRPKTQPETQIEILTWNVSGELQKAGNPLWYQQPIQGVQVQEWTGFTLGPDSPYNGDQKNATMYTPAGAGMVHLKIPQFEVDSCMRYECGSTDEETAAMYLASKHLKVVGLWFSESRREWNATGYLKGKP